MGGKRPAIIALICLGAGLLLAAALILSGPGVRGGLWSWSTGLTILRWSAWTGLGVFVVSLVACFYLTRGSAKPGLACAAIGGLCGLLVFAIPASNLNKARSLPRIHDITTDTQNPPTFVEIGPIRARTRARNKIVYGGEEIAAQQRKGYPDIVPLNTTLPARRAYDTSLAVAVELGWQIIASVPGKGRIEATDTTFWFGFTDDISIRVTALAAGSRIDIRSVSRVGRSDVGTNAARIRRFLSAVKSKLNA